MRWLSPLFSRKPSRKSKPAFGPTRDRRRQHQPLLVEILEERTLLSTVDLALVQDPQGSNFFTKAATGSLPSPNAFDVWRFTAQAGDHVSVAGDGGQNGSAIYLELHNPNDAILAQTGDYNSGHSRLTNVAIPADGTYYVRTHTYNSGSTLASYSLRVDIARGFDSESKPDDSPSNASPITLTPGAAGHATGKTAGQTVTASDVSFFKLGSLRTGDKVDLSAVLPSVSTLDPHVRLIRGTGNTVVAEASGTTHVNFTLTADDQYYAQVTANTPATAGPEAIYLLQVDIASSTSPTVSATSLPAAGATLSSAIDRFAVTFSQDLLVSAANTAANYSLVETASGTIYPLTPTYAGLGSDVVNFVVNTRPLQAGHYHFQTQPGLTDRAGNAVTTFTREFTIVDPVAGKIEGIDDTSIPTATALPMTETPAGSHFFTSLGVGSLFDTNDRDYWRFDAEAGDQVSIRIEADTVNVYPQLQILNAAGQNQINVGGDYYGNLQLDSFTIPKPGTYYLAVSDYNAPTHYQMRVDQSRGTQLKAGNPDSQDHANWLTLTPAGAGTMHGVVAGALPVPDSSGDYYRLGTLNTGNTLTLTAALPSFGSLKTGDVTLSLERAGGGAVATSTSGTLNYTLTSDGVYYARIQATADRSIRAQYLLNLSVADTVTPRVATVSLLLSPIPTLFGTGVDSSGAPLADGARDPHYQLTASADPAFPGPGAYVVNAGYPVGSTWFGNSATSKWIAPQAGNSAFANPGTYIYHTTFDLTGFDPATAQLSGRWAADDTGQDIRLNGQSTGISGAGFSNWSSFTISSGFVAGVNTLDFVLTNAGSSPNPTGLRVELSGVAQAAVVTTTAVVDRFTVTFSKDMAAGTVNDVTNFDLRAADSAGRFDTSGVTVYHLVSYGYSNGLAASFRISDGPLQPGKYQFTAGTGLSDRAANHLAAPYVRTFTVAGVAPFITAAQAVGNTSVTTLSAAPSTKGDGTISSLTSFAAAGNNPYAIATAKLTGSGHLDLVTANQGSNSVSIFLGNGDGTFQNPLTYPVGAGPLSVAIADLNGDGKPDLVVANESGNTLSILFGNGDGTFKPAVNVTVGRNPYAVSVADLNGDGKLDLVAANNSDNTVSVLLGNGNGTFQAPATFATGRNPVAVRIADLNGDSKPDLVVANNGDSTVSILTGNGDGTFKAPVAYPVGPSPLDVVVADLNGDGKPDVVSVNQNNNTASVLLNKGDGTLLLAVSYSTGPGNPYRLTAADLRGSGKLDLIVANYNNSRLAVLLGKGDGTFENALSYSLGGNPIAVTTGDFNGDGRLDVATANYGNSTVSILTGNNLQPLTADPANSGLFSGYGRGNLSTNNARNYWTWTGKAGDAVTLAVEGQTSNSNLSYTLYTPTGDYLTSFCSDYYTGRGQLGPVTLPVSGRYSVLVSPCYYDYEGEYRLRISEVSPPLQAVSRFGTSISDTNVPTFTNSAPGHLTAQEAGYLGLSDGGDFFRLGNVIAGTTITVNQTRPSTSSLAGVLAVLNAAGTVVASSAAGAASLSFTIPTGQDGTYYARLSPAASSNGLLAQYLLSFDLADTRPPAITAVSWPAEGATSSAVLDRVTVSFSKDMAAAAVNDVSNFDLRAADATGNFDTSGATIYHLVSYGYSSGLTASFRVSDGPLQPGTYRFTISTGLTDRTGNHLAAAVVRTFTVAGVAPFVLANRADPSSGVATTTLSTAPSTQGDGSLSGFTSFTAGGNNPYAIATGKLTSSGRLDLVTANISSNTISVFLGNGNGTFKPAVTYNVGPNPLSVVLADLNGDGILDLAIANEGGSTLSILFGNGDGTFKPAVSVSVGRNPYAVSAADLNGDGKLDLVAANAGDNTVSVLLGNGNGTFKAPTTLVAGRSPYAVRVADLNGDGQLDLVVANHDDNTVSVFPGKGDGTFGAAANYPVGPGPQDVIVADLNGDGKPDVVSVNQNNNSASVLLNKGDGTLLPAASYSTGPGNPYRLTTADLRGSGKLDLIVANYNSSRLAVLLGKGDGTFENALSYSLGGNPIAVTTGDFNGDGRLDVATANYGNSTVSILTGNALQPLTADPANSGLFSGYGRGNLSTNNARNYWTWTGKAGDAVTLAVEGQTSNSNLSYTLYLPTGDYLTSFCSDYYTGRGQLGPVTLPVSGRYSVLVSPCYYDYEGEYRLRVSEVSAPLQTVYRFGTSISDSNVPTFTNSAPGHLTAQEAGYLGLSDGGDFFRLGNIVAGTMVTLSQSKPSTSSLSGVLAVLNAAGTVVASSAAGAASLSFTIPAGQDGTYYARISPASGSNGLLAQYLLSFDLADTHPPTVTAVSWPAEGATSSAVLDRVTVSFSKDMAAAAVNDVSNFDLRAADATGNFDTSGATIYHLVSYGYSSGLSDSFRVSDGPLQPGTYRFTISTGLTDRTGNRLAAVYTRTFNVVGVTPFVLANRADPSSGVATTTLSPAPSTQGDGSLSGFTSFTAGGNNPYAIATGKLTSSGRLDLVTANISSNTISVFLGNGNGTFKPAVTYNVGPNPLSVVLADLNGDGNLDLAVANNGGSTLSILFGNGDGTFKPAVSVSVGRNPYAVSAADLNGDGNVDLVAANNGDNTVSVLLGNGNGTFKTPATFTTGRDPVAVRIADLNGDGKLDLVTADNGDNTVSVLAGKGDGTFGPAVHYGVGPNPLDVIVVDLNGDGKPDVVSVNQNNNTASVLLNKGDGTLLPAASYSTGPGNPYRLTTADLRGSGKLDLIVANYNSSRLAVLLGKGDGTFENALSYSLGGNPIAVTVGDFNGDGRLDVATANYGNSTVSILTGNALQPLTADPANSGLFSGYGRGNLSTNNARAYWTWTGKAGDLVTVAVEGQASNSNLSYTLYLPTGDYLTSFCSDYYTGRGQLGPVTLPASGRYSVLVSPCYYDYEGEYRLRISEVSPPLQAVYRFGTSINDSNVPAFANASLGHMMAQEAGYLGLSDGGDFFRLGNIVAGTTVTLSQTLPSTSSLSGVLAVLNASGAVVASSAPGAATFTYTVPGNQDGLYYARISAANGTNGLLAQYLLAFNLTDNVAPVITSVSWPATGKTTTAVVDRFSLNFSKDMAAATINNVSNFDLQMADIAGNFDSNFAVHYTLASPGYSNGLGVQFRITDGPLQPGSYRFMARTTVTDRFGNRLTVPFVRTFVVAGVAPYILQNRADPNSDVATTTLSTMPSTQADGSLSGFTSFAAGGYNPYAIATGKLTQNGQLDLVTANSGSNTISVFLGKGDGTFKAPVTYNVGPNPLSVVLADLNGDGILDVAVANEGGSTLSILFGNGDGTFKPAISVTVGRNPYAVSAADLNGDGTLDLVAANNGDNTVSVLLGNGNGTFKAPITVGVGRGPVAVRVADLNGDGKPDLVVANNGDNNVSVLLGNGNGTFGTRINYSVGPNPLDVIVADLNGDGKPDVVSVNQNNNTVSVLLNKGDGTLLPAVSYGTGASGPYRLTTADLRGSGKLDLIVANYNSSRLGVLLGKGDGTFENALNYSLGGNPIAVTVGDFNGDGRLDVATANYGNSTVSILTGNNLQPLAVDPVSSGLSAGFGRGNLSTTNYRASWTWTGKAGDLVTVAVEGQASYSNLSYTLYTPTGDYLTSFCSDYYTGRGQLGPVTLPATGRYSVLVSPCYYDYEGEYDLRVSEVAPPLQMEAESNDDINHANLLHFTTSGMKETASVAGAITTGGDLDYFNLGTVQPGMTIFLSTRKPISSPLDPVVSLYDASNGYVVKTSGRPFDSVAQIDITKAGAYYAVMRGGNGTGGVLDQYILDVQIVPTGTINFASLQVGNIQLPHGAIQSGQQITFSFTVTNIGNQATDVASWSDRAVLSLDKIYGNTDDISLGVWRHTGVLNPNGSYTVTQTVTLPDGITGDYHLIVEADTYHEVNLFVLRGSNITASDNTFHVALAPYPDLTVDGLKATNPGPDGKFTVSWYTANHGNGPANGTWKDRVFVKDLVTGIVVLDTEVIVTGPLAVNGTIPHSVTGTVGSDAGPYEVIVTTDAENQIFEFNADGYAAAKANDTSMTSFDATLDLQVANLQATPATLQSSGTVLVKWNDTVSGNHPAVGSWYDLVSITNATTHAVLVSATVYHDGSTGSIPDGGSLAQQVLLTLPDGQAGVGTLIITVTVDYYDQVVEYIPAMDAKANNTSSITVTSKLAAYPDLQVTGLTLSPPNGIVSGATVVVNWNDSNTGTGPTPGSWSDYLVIVNTTTHEMLAVASLYYDATVNGAILPGGFRARQYALTLPDGIRGVGNLQVMVTTNYYNQFFEFNTDGTGQTNNANSITVPALLAAYPDLQVANVKVEQPASLASGTHVVVGWDDNNIGNAAVPGSYYDNVLVQKVNGDGTLTTIAAGNVQAANNLAAGGSIHLRFSFDLPNGAAGVGQFRITITADAGNQVKEYDRQGNLAKDNNTASLTVTSVLAAYADLKVSGVTVPNFAFPKQPVTITYTVSNVGNATANPSWTDSVYLATDPTGANPRFLMSFPYTSALAAGASQVVNHTINLPDTGLEGTYYFVVTVNSGSDVYELNRANNTAVAGQGTLLPQTISVILPVGTISETGTPFQALVQRSGNPANPLTLYLNIQDSQGNPNRGHLSVPATVTIPAGQATAFFTVTPIWDHRVTGTLNLMVEAQTTSGTPQPSTLTAAAPIQVTDVDKPRVSLSFVSSQLSDGQATQGTVSIEPASVLPVTVTLMMNITQQLSFPTTLTIPAGQTTAAFTIAALNLPDMQVNHDVVVDAGVVGYLDGTAVMHVLHNNLINLTVTLAPGQIPENALGIASVGTVTRSVITPRDLVVDLASNLTSAARVPAQVTIPAGQASAQFPIYAVDDPTHQFKPTRTVTISANATDPFTGDEISRGAGSTTIQVLNAYGPTFSLASNRGTIPQGGSAIGTVTRNTGTTGALVVALTSSDTTAATVPATVTIPDGAASATFPIKGVDTATNGNRLVTITANATGFSPGAFSVIVTDIHLPDLRVTTVTAPKTGLTGQTFTVSWTVANEGLLAAGPAWVDRVYLSTQPVLTSDAIQLGQYDINGTLGVGQQYTQTANGLKLPDTPGPYYVIVNTDSSNAIVELDKNNNTFVVPQQLQVAAAYHARVASTVRQGTAGQPVTLHGTATLTGTGAPAPYVVVSVYVRHNGTSRPLSALTDANGNYSVNFQPLPGEGGDYQVGADHPGVPDASIANQDNFTIIGFGAVPPTLSQSIVAGKSVQGTVQITNLSNVALTGLQATLQGQPANLTIQVSVASSLAGNASTTLTYTIHATDASVRQAVVTINLTTAQGATLPIPLNVAVIAPLAHLTGPSILQTGMVRGEQATWEFTVTNDGGAPTGPIQVALPKAPWLLLATPQTMPSVDPGQSANVDLILAPSATLPLGPYTGTIGLNYAGTGLTVPFSFNNISNAMGDVQITVVDENTYYGANKTGLAKANVSLLSPFDGSTIVSGVTDATGNVSFLGVREGAYNLQVTAAKHDGYRATFMVSPGKVNSQTIFVRTQLVTYNWQVQNIEVEDRTNVTLQTTFTTTVPVPVVTIDPGVIDLATIKGNFGTINLTVTNHGLIAARNVKISFPSHPYWQLTPLISNIGDLAANSSLTIPVTIRRLQATGPQGADSAACNFQAELDWTLICGPFNTVYPVPIFVLHATNCPTGGGGVPVFGGGGGGGGGSGGGGSGGTVSGPTATYYSPPPSCACDPNTFHEQGVKGEIGFSAGLFTSWIASMATKALSLAGIPFSIEEINFKTSISGEIDTCCENKTQGLKAKAEGSIGVEGKARLGYSLPNLPEKDIMVDGLGEVHLEASAFGGIELTISGEFQGEYETDCNFANPHLKVSGKLSFQVFGGVSAKAEATYTDPKTGQKYGAALEGKVGLMGGGYVAVEGSEKGISFQACQDDITFEASIGGELSVGTKKFTVEDSYHYTIVPKHCYSSGGGEGGGGGGDSPNSGLPSLNSIMPEPLTPARLAALNGYASVAEMVRGFTGGILPFPISDSSSSADVAHAMEAADTPSAQAILGTVHYASLVQSDNQQPPPPSGDNGVCAQVQLQLDQQAVLTRKAIGATLDINNASDTDPVQNLYVTITIYDAQGNDATDKFIIQPPKLTNLTVTNDGSPPPGYDATKNGPWTGLPGWLLAPGSTGTASWVILPSDAAAPDGPVVYKVGGSFTYTQNGVPHSILLLPGPVTVYPNPQLDINYFLQRDVYAQDPFVNYTMPSIPYALGVLVTNSGKGVAQNFHIVSAQPRIVENYKGLQISFSIIGTQVEGKSFSPSLTVDFGDINPGQTVVGEWLFTSSLQGHFINYTASYEHTDQFGGMAASLIHHVAIHEMIHAVKPTQVLKDGLPGFLVNDLPTDSNLPDTIYLDDGSKAPVTQATNGQADHAPTPGSLQVQVTATMQQGWSYLQMPDPANGKYHLVRIVRSDGFELPVGDDAWVTDRTFGLDPTARPTYENILHLIDFNSTGKYTFYYAPNDTTPPVIQQLAPIISPRTTAIDEEDVTFSKAINPATFTRAALVLTRDGGTNLITTAVTITRISDTVYAIRGLASLTGTDGIYHLIVSAAGVQDTLGNLGTGTLDITWTMAAQAPTVVSITGTVALRNTPVSSLVVTFNKPIDLTTFDYHVLSLTLNNGPNLITSAVTITQTGTSTYQINGLNRLTGSAGQYTLTIQVTAIKDQAGHLGTGLATLSWTVDTTAPILAADGLATVASPRATTVTTLDVTFSKPIDLTTFTYRALTLTRNGGANLITNSVAITWVSGATYRINDLDSAQAGDGTYVLTVDASMLQDAAGNAGKGMATQSWVIKTTAPAMPTNLTVVPTGAGVVRNGVSSTLAVTLSGSLGAAGLVVHLYDATALTSLPDAIVTGTSFSRALVFSTPGAHRIEVQAADAAGNLSAPAFFDLFIDTTPPSVSQVVGIVPNATKNPVATVDVVFSKPIDPTTFDYHQLTLTRNGGANLITATSGVRITFISGATFRISGLDTLTRAEGVYVLTVSAVGVKDSVGNQGVGSASTQWTDDQTPPRSMVLPLPAQSNTPSFLVQWTGTDLPNPGGSGIAFFDIYVAVDGGSYSVWQSQTTATSATYTGQVGHRYAFYSVATDRAGNVEPAHTTADTQTFIPAVKAEIHGFVYHDTNGQKVPLAGWTVFLDLNQNGKLDMGEPSTTTDAGGAYQFLGLAAGIYAVTEVVPDGWVQLTPSGANSVTVIAGQIVQNVNFTSRLKPPVVTSPGNQNRNEGDRISLQIQATGADHFSATGLPAGLAIDNHGLITGTIDAVAAGTYSVTITAANTDASTPVMFTWTVADAPLSVTAVPVATTEGTAFSGLVATFTDAGGIPPVGTFTVTINWGDGTPTTSGTVSLPGSTFQVNGSHTFAEAGSFHMTVTVQDRGGASAMANPTATVADAALTATPVTLAATEGTALKKVVMASFTDANPQASAADFSTTIDWGDGSPLDTRATVMPGDNGSFVVVGHRHKYVDEGSYMVVVRITDVGGSTAEADSTITVTDAPLSATAVNLTATEGTALKKVVVATFSDANRHATAADFSATIDWGDGSPLDSKAMIVADHHGNFQVVGHRHKYADEGSYNVVVIISDVGGSTAEADSTITVADAPLTAAGVDLAATEGTALKGVVVAGFRDANHHATAAEFSATIDWGDGSPLDSKAVIVADHHGNFQVVGHRHKYADEGSYTITVTITDVGGSTATATSTVTVADADLAGSGMDVTATTGISFQGVVAQFTDASRRASAGDFSATIDWGDGSDLDSTATIVRVHQGQGTFLVQGSHTYDQANTYTITITLTDVGGNTITLTATATVTDDSGSPSTATHQPDAPLTITFTSFGDAGIVEKPTLSSDANRDATTALRSETIQVSGRFAAELVSYITPVPALTAESTSHSLVLPVDYSESGMNAELVAAFWDNQGPLTDAFFSREDWYA